jgi:uncharacterized protein YlzI (FlbEa/FlbD family)
MIRLAAELLIALHTVDGREIAVNPAHVTHMRQARPDSDADNKAFASGVHCMVNLSDGKFVTVVEDCDEVRRLIERKSP